jgi:hypothetical protein
MYDKNMKYIFLVAKSKKSEEIVMMHEVKNAKKNDSKYSAASTLNNSI